MAADDEVDAEHLVGVADNAFWERKVEVDPYDGEDEAEGEPREGVESVQWVWPLHETAVVEDQSALQTLLWDCLC